MEKYTICGILLVVEFIELGGWVAKISFTLLNTEGDKKMYTRTVRKEKNVLKL